MKLKLTEHKNVPVLVVTDAVRLDQVAVLRAGLRKLLRTGKNQIVVDLSGATELAPDAITELAGFHAVAMELAGRIVLVSSMPAVIEAVAKLPPPTLLPVAASIEAAVQLLTEAGKADGEDDSEELTFLRQREARILADIAELDANVKALTEQAAAAKGDEHKKLRAENSWLRRTIRAIETQLEKLPAPPSPEVPADLIKRLEALDAAAFSAVKQKLGLG